MTQRKRQRGPGRQRLARESFHLTEEVRSIQQRAAHHDGRIVSIGPLVLFSTETGDAWILDPADHLAAPLPMTEIRFRSTLRKPTPIMLSAGKDAIRSTAMHSLYEDHASRHRIAIRGYPTSLLMRVTAEAGRH